MLRNLFDSPWHVIILLLVVVLLFGAKRLPDATRSVARSLRIFKSEVREMKDEDVARKSPGPLEGRVVEDERRADNDSGLPASSQGTGPSQSTGPSQGTVRRDV